MADIVYLQVPPEEQEYVQENGAFWEPKMKKWAIKPTTPKAEWIIRNFSGFIVRPEYLIPNPVLCGFWDSCWKCSRRRMFLSLGTYLGYYILETEFGTIAGRTTDKYFIFRNVLLDINTEENVINELNKHGLGFKYSRQAKMTYLGNICRSCGALLGDAHRYNKIDGTFWNISPDKMVTVELPFERISFYGYKI